MRLTVHPERIDLAPGEVADVAVTVERGDGPAAAFRVRPVGLPDAWSAPFVDTPVLAAGDRTTVVLQVALPAGFPAGHHVTAIEAIAVDAAGRAPEEADADHRALADLVLAVGAVDSISAQLEPRNVSHKGNFRVALHNRGDEPVALRFSARSPGGDLRFAFDPEDVELQAGEFRAVKGRVKGRRPLLGDTRRRVFTILAQGRGSPLHLQGAFVQMPRLRGNVVKVVAIAVIVALWAAALVFGVNELRSGDDEDTPQADATAVVDTGEGGDGEGGDGGAAGDGGGGGEGGGEVAPGEQQPVAEPLAAVGGTVEADEPDGVAVRLRRISLVDEAAATAEFVSTVKPKGEPVKIAGRHPSPVKGRVAPEIFETRTDEGGSYGFAAVPAPGFYELTFSKPGYQTRNYVVETMVDGEPVVLDVEMAAGKGSVAGVVRDASGPLGGAEVVMTDGEVEFSTVTADAGEAVGGFRFDGVSTPAQLVIKASRPGYGTESVNVTLAGGASVDGVTLTLEEGVGSIAGHVTSDDGPLGNVTVTLFDDDTVRTTSTLTEGDVGFYDFEQIEHGSYTLVFEADGWLLQSQSIELDGNAEVNAALTRSTGTVAGRITDEAGAVLGGVGVTLANDEVTYKTTSAGGETLSAAATSDEPNYELSGIEPGTYVLTFERFESEPATKLVEVEAGVSKLENVSLVDRDITEVESTATIAGTLKDAVNPLPVVGAEIFLGDDLENVVTVSTDTGDFTVADLPPGVHTITIVSPDHEVEVRRTSVGIGQDVNLGTILLQQRAELSGVVRRAVDRVPIRDATVCLRPNGVTAGGCLVEPPPITDGVGFYRFERVEAGFYTLEFSAPGFVDAFENIEIGRSEFARLDPVLDRLPVVRIETLQPSPADPSILEPRGNTPVVTPPGSVQSSDDPDGGPDVFDTDGNGDLELVMHAAGTYSFRAQIDPATQSTTEATITVGANQIVDATIVVHDRPGVTSGTVVYDYPLVGGTVEERPVGAGVQVTNTGIYGYDAGGTPQNQSRTAFTSSLGAFSFGESPIDDSLLSVAASAGWNGTTSPTAVPSGTAGVELEVTPKANGALFGTVSSTAFESTDGATVTLSGGPLLTPSVTNLEATVSGGSFSFTGLEPGQYQVDVELDDTHAEGSAVVDVRPTETTFQHFTLQKFVVATVQADGLATQHGSKPDVTLSAWSIPATSSGGPPCSAITSASKEHEQAFDNVTTSSVSTDFRLLPGTWCFQATRTKGGSTETIATFPHTFASGAAPSPFLLSFSQLGGVSGTLQGILSTFGSEHLEAIQGAVLNLVPAGGGATVATATTGTTGSFTFDELAAGSYDLTVSSLPQGYTNPGTIQTSISVTGGANAAVGTLKITAQKALVQGTVYSNSNTSGNELAGATVRLRNTTTGQLLTTTTDDGSTVAADEGKFSFANVDPLSGWSIEITAPDHAFLSRPINVPKGATVTLTEVLTEVLSSLSGVVSGEVANDVTPLDGATVTLRRQEPGGTVLVGTFTSGSGSQPDGGYLFEDLTSGNYRIEFTATGYGPETVNNFTVSGGVAFSQDQTLDALPIGVEITVRARQPGGTSPGSLLGGVSVTLAGDPAAGDRQGLTAETAQTTDGTTGVATFNNVDPGDYLVTVEGDELGYTRETFSLSVDPGTGPVTQTYEVEPSTRVVVRKNGVPVLATVEAEPQGSGSADSATTNATTGVAELQLSPDDYHFTVKVGTIEVVTDDPHTIAASATQTEITYGFRDVTITVTDATVTSGNNGRNGVVVTLSPDTGSASPGLSSPSGTTSGSGSNAGRVTFTVDEGDYDVDVDGSNVFYTSLADQAFTASSSSTTASYSLRPWLKIAVQDDSSTPVSLSGARVQVFDGSTEVFDANTSASGFVEAAISDDPSYTVTITKSGYQTLTGTALTFTGGASQVTRTFTLQQLFTVTVTVTASGGGALQNVDVDLEPSASGGGSTNPGEQQTSSSGVATFTVTRGNYDITVDGSDTGRTTTVESSVSVQANVSKSYSLSPSLQVTVLDHLGAAANGADVDVDPAGTGGGSSNPGSVNTGTDHIVTLNVNTDGSYDIECSKGGLTGTASVDLDIDQATTRNVTCSLPAPPPPPPPGP